jgi:hypothetical protein
VIQKHRTKDALEMRQDREVDDDGETKREMWLRASSHSIAAAAAVAGQVLQLIVAQPLNLLQDEV